MSAKEVFLLVVVVMATFTRLQAAPSTRIRGGREVHPGEVTYQLSLQFEGGRHFCGASLVEVSGIQLAVSAAHCFGDFSSTKGPIYVVAGDLDLEDQSGAEQSRKLIKAVIHPDYGNVANDIALLFFKTPFNLNANVSTIPLPSQVKRTTEQKLIVTGWGRLSYGGPLPNHLQLIELPVVSDEACKSAWESLHLNITESMICAATPDGEQSPCHGDSGGPAANSNPSYLAGVVSFGYECGHPDYPGVFTAVAYYIDWIEDQANLFMDGTLTSV